jgi:hypothetical protein
MLCSGSRKREHGLAPLSSCGPSLTLGVQLSLDAFFLSARTNDSNPFPSARQPSSLRDTRRSARPRPSPIAHDRALRASQRRSCWGRRRSRVGKDPRDHGGPKGQESRSEIELEAGEQRPAGQLEEQAGPDRAESRRQAPPPDSPRMPFRRPSIVQNDCRTAAPI